MKIFTSISFLCLWASALIAQPTITRALVLSPGDKVYVQESESIPDPGMAGADVTWDFSAVVVDTNVIGIAIADADTTPNFSEFPTSNIAEIYTFGGGQSTQYDLITNSSYEVLGSIFPGVSKFVYSDPVKYLVFPFTYNSQWQDTYASTLDFIISPITITAEGTIDALVDGYGTLIMPHTTFTDALRLKVIEESTDTSNLGQGLSEKNINHDTTFFWLSPSYPGPLCSYTRSVQEHFVYLTTPDTVIVDSETIESTSFSLDPMSGTSAVRDDITPGKYTMQVSPNPFDRAIEMAFTSDQPKEMQFVLDDLHGNTVFRQDISAQAGENIALLSLPEMPSGVYIAILQSSDGADVQKLIRIEGLR